MARHSAVISCQICSHVCHMTEFTRIITNKAATLVITHEKRITRSNLWHIPCEESRFHNPNYEGIDEVVGAESISFERNIHSLWYSLFHTNSTSVQQVRH